MLNAKKTQEDDNELLGHVCFAIEVLLLVLSNPNWMSQTYYFIQFG